MQLAAEELIQLKLVPFRLSISRPYSSQKHKYCNTKTQIMAKPMCVLYQEYFNDKN